ncbi:MAG TPA: hypothetical protein VFQ44_29515 [Streptosporangiaceae bacterium]|nr:hypothetical protein [Streptosporangiaceae bacterium]
MRVSIEAEELTGQLAEWERTQSERNGSADDFPYEQVMSFFRAHGKHFVPNSVLQALAAIRGRVDLATGRDPEEATLARFLTIALDKWDDTYSYETYLGLQLLELVADADGELGRRQREEWVTLLLADAWEFERGARDGTHDLLPIMRPDPYLAGKRMRLLEGIISVAASSVSDAGGDGCGSVSEMASRYASPRTERALSLCMQPVYIVHDEYLFIRTLQSVEVTFAAMVADLRDAIGAVRAGDAQSAAASIFACSQTLAGARSLFSVLATMRIEAFRAFRIYTTGASAIQSGNYKTFEALCSRPPDARIQSPAYEAVPRVRERVLDRWASLLSTVEDATAAGLVDGAGLRLIRQATAELEKVHQRWKQTHWKMADRMIGDDRGTGYTEGVPYLKDALENRLFSAP